MPEGKPGCQIPPDEEGEKGKETIPGISRVLRSIG
jgi:hypothetical protein